MGLLARVLVFGRHRVRSRRVRRHRARGALHPVLPHRPSLLVRHRALGASGSVAFLGVRSRCRRRRDHVGASPSRDTRAARLALGGPRPAAPCGRRAAARRGDEVRGVLFLLQRRHRPSRLEPRRNPRRALGVPRGRPRGNRSGRLAAPALDARRSDTRPRGERLARRRRIRCCRDRGLRRLHGRSRHRGRTDERRRTAHGWSPGPGHTRRDRRAGRLLGTRSDAAMGGASRRVERGRNDDDPGRSARQRLRLPPRRRDDRAARNAPRAGRHLPLGRRHAALGLLPRQEPARAGPERAELRAMGSTDVRHRGSRRREARARTLGARNRRPLGSHEHVRSDLGP